MSKSLVAYFSASGVTGKTAKRLAEEIGADLLKGDIKTDFSVFSKAELEQMYYDMECNMTEAQKNFAMVVEMDAVYGEGSTLFIGQALQSFYSIVDMLVVGRIVGESRRLQRAAC